jgi:hypothetical protein
MNETTYRSSIGVLASCWFAASVYRLLLLAHRDQLTQCDSGQFLILFPILFVAVGVMVWLIQSRSKLLQLHATQYGIMLLIVAVVFSTVIIYAPHDTASEHRNEPIGVGVSSK